MSFSSPHIHPFFRVSPPSVAQWRPCSRGERPCPTQRRSLIIFCCRHAVVRSVATLALRLDFLKKYIIKMFVIARPFLKRRLRHFGYCAVFAEECAPFRRECATWAGVVFTLTPVIFITGCVVRRYFLNTSHKARDLHPPPRRAALKPRWVGARMEEIALGDWLAKSHNYSDFTMGPDLTLPLESTDFF